jgi:hypothetical protein
MRRLLFFACLLLAAACSPVVVTVPAAGGELLPEQVQRQVDQWTATARAQSTQAAGATATGISARETSTAAALGTLGALAARQTEAALGLTQAAGQVAATDAASVKTQGAAATSAWATPTAAAMRTQAAITEREQQRRLANAESAAEFWRTLRAIITVLVVVGGVVAAVVVVVDRLTRVQMFKMREKAAIAREAFRLLGPGHWAEWQPADGYQVYPLPERLDEPPVLLENPEYRADRLQAWRHAVRLFAWWGDRYGFGIRDLGPAGAGVVTDPAWRKLSKLLKDAGVLAEVAMPDQKGKVTTWADGWSYPRFSDELGSLRPPVALPTGDEPPVVRFAVPTNQIEVSNARNSTHAG